MTQQIATSGAISLIFVLDAFRFAGIWDENAE